MDDRARVAELLGREPAGAFEVVVRNGAGDPVVVRNAPFLVDGTPMPTRFYLVGANEVREVSRLRGDQAGRLSERISPLVDRAVSYLASEMDQGRLRQAEVVTDFIYFTDDFVIVFHAFTNVCKNFTSSHSDFSCIDTIRAEHCTTSTFRALVEVAVPVINNFFS